jgi:hypothetical protein
MSGCWGFESITVASSQGQAIYKCWQLLTQQSVLFQKTRILSKTAVRISNLSRYLGVGIEKGVHMIQVIKYIGYFCDKEKKSPQAGQPVPQLNLQLCVCPTQL